MSLCNIYLNRGHGGGIITWKSKSALILVLAIAMSVFPSVGAAESQNTSSNTQIILSDKSVLEVNAAKKSKVKKSYKYKKTSYKKVKAAYKYKKSRYKYKKVKASSIVQGNPQIVPQTVSANAKCSCSLHTDYNVHTGTWVNYCPYCNKYGTISYTNGQGCPEGMFYCDRNKGGCDADYCIVHGKSHTYSGSKYLTPA
ncbi:hypothetical protein [Methanobacterium sp.]|uniref:hypothetical protein n=1 Tax=Methanobacterium sp. TaxID=2164 RepID=UPI003D6617E2